VPTSKPPEKKTRAVSLDDVRRAQEVELVKIAGELEKTRFALNREVDKTAELERRLGVAKDAVHVRHKRIAELEQRLRAARVEVKKLEEAVDIALERILKLTEDVVPKA
jgi:hypothetical protein